MSRESPLTGPSPESGGGDAEPASGPLPSVAVPKGGGALRGIGEKFSVNAASGTGGLTVPVPLSPGRNSFGPQLALGYDSGSGNGPFGLGWDVSVPAITRKTDKGLPRYLDGESSDTYVLSGAEDLVALLDAGLLPVTRTEVVGGHTYAVARFVPRTEGLYARIERWTDETGDTHWRSVSPENTLTVYGRTPASRIADPDAPTHVAAWLISESYDVNGNAVRYRYKAEDSDGVPTGLPHERNRTPAGRAAARYLKRIHYGNRTPCEAGADLDAVSDWMFQAVLDYGEHYAEDGAGEPVFVSADDTVRPWALRLDPLSSFRTGFEVRTYRLCRRILLFHHFPDELGTPDCLVNATHLGHSESATVSLLTSVTQSGYVRRADGTYLKRSLPALTLGYSAGALDTTVHEVDAESLVDLPTGRNAAWVDLDGDGVAGVLTEDDDSWLYKRNLSPVGAEVQFAPARQIATRPAPAAQERLQWVDVAGDGQPDLVRLTGNVRGYFERGSDGGWERFAPFLTTPNVVWDADVTLADLTGDGRPDVLLTRDDAITWYPSLGEEGFGRGESVPNDHDEERGPRLVLADAQQSVHLADLSGDGLADLVRIRNGEVCYWPNRGYGRFGAKVTMDGAPWFDAPDCFDARRLRLADVDGSGPTDLLYVADDGVRLYVNQSGNSWAAPQLIDGFPLTDRPEAVQVADLRGNGTACLVWASELAAEQGRRLRYLDLTGGVKPHLLVQRANGLGAVTTITYASSTRFALADDLAGRPWATRLPFPVHVVERVAVDDLVDRTRFTTRYAYHHGYFDGPEREFRGFGCVEQWDTEELAVLTASDDLPPANVDPVSHVPPVLTRSWFHTGAFLDGERLERAYEQEFYAEPGLDETQRRALLPHSSFPDDLAPDEAREATRALKGVLLRKEVYGLDGSDVEAHPYTVTEQSYEVQRLQRRGPNRYCVFRTLARESVDLQYERSLTKVGPATVADPRVHHQLVLDVDAYGHLLSSVDIVYGRRHADPSLAPLDQALQAKALVTANVNTYTAAVDTATAYRAPQLCETQVYELLNVVAPALPAPALVELEELRALVTAAGDGAHDLPYEDVDGTGATPGHPFRRRVEHTRTLFRKDDLSGPLPFKALESRALHHETYALAFTPALLTNVYGTRVTAALLAGEGRYVHADGGPDWWTTTGRVFFSPNAADTPAQELAYARAHFFLPLRAVDPFGSEGVVTYDAHDFLPLETRDPLGNRVTAGDRGANGAVTPRLDYRTLQPLLVTDANRNRTAIAYDALGRLAGVAVMGKTEESAGDSLAGFVPDLDAAKLAAFATDPLGTATGLLGGASRRILYDLDRFAALGEPAFSATLARETHVSDPQGNTRLQVTIAHADGSGATIQQKVRVEPGPLVEGGPVATPRWIGSAWAVLDNKGHPVRTYEPFFTGTHHFEFARKEGVSDIVFYDPVGRAVGRLHPNHTYDKTVFGPWRQEAWSSGDTVLQADPRLDPHVGGWFARLPVADFLPAWHEARAGGALGANEQDAAAKSAIQSDTPTISHYDPMGRPFLTTEESGSGPVANRLRVDIEGNTLAVVDSLGRAAVTSAFDIQGRRLRQASIDSGERWQLPDTGGKTIRSWDGKDTLLRTEYDALHRVTGLYVTEAGGAEHLRERIVFGESQGEALNHRGRTFQQFDAAGVTTSVAFDFEGNLLRERRELAVQFDADPDWSAPVALGAESFESTTTFDALKRPVRVEGPDGTVTRIRYDDGGLLSHTEANVRGEAAVTVFLESVEHTPHGTPARVTLGNGVTTTYDYDPDTFGLRRMKSTRGATVLQDIDYTRDPSGNVTSRRDAAQQKTFFANAVVDAGMDYTYDALHRLVQASGREHVGQGVQTPEYEPHDAPRVGLAHPQDGQAMRRYTERYAYDAVGNLLSVAHTAPQGSWTRRYQYDAASNRLDSSSFPGDAAGALPPRYPHDANGNITAMPHLAGLTWDFKNRLRHVDLGGGGSAHYVYDGQGARVRKVLLRPNGTKRFERLYLGTLEIAREYAGDGTTLTLERQTLHSGKGAAVVIESRTFGVDPGAARLARYQLPDSLGSIALELDGAGAIISFEEYYPFGGSSYQAVRSQTETPKEARYNGKERDGETGLSAYGARYYAPWLGRWTSADPAGMVDGTNLFAYVRNNPVNAVDPDGHGGFGDINNHEGMYKVEVKYKNSEEYQLSESGTEHIDNADGTVTAWVWRKTPPVTIAPQKPAGKPAPAKPKQQKPAAQPKEDPPPISAHDLTNIALALSPKLIYPKPVRQFFGGVQFVGGSLETVTGVVAGVFTSETVVGAVGGFAVAAHGVDNASSGWTLMTTGNESKTWTFQIGAGYASMVTKDVELQNAIGSSTETLANIGSAGYGMYSAANLPSPKLVMPGVVADADVSVGMGVNTGKDFIGRINCGFCTIAGADAVPMTSTEEAAAAGVFEGGHPGLYTSEFGDMLKARGLGSGTPDLVGATAADAKTFMAGMPQGTKFGIFHAWQGQNFGHYINARVGTFGLYFIDNQATLGSIRPYFNLPPNATNVWVWTLYSPHW